MNLDNLCGVSDDGGEIDRDNLDSMFISPGHLFGDRTGRLD